MDEQDDGANHHHQRADHDERKTLRRGAGTGFPQLSGSAAAFDDRRRNHAPAGTEEGRQGRHYRRGRNACFRRRATRHPGPSNPLFPRPDFCGAVEDAAAQEIRSRARATGAAQGRHVNQRRQRERGLCHPMNAICVGLIMHA